MLLYCESVVWVSANVWMIKNVFEIGYGIVENDACTGTSRNEEKHWCVVSCV